MFILFYILYYNIGLIRINYKKILGESFKIIQDINSLFFPSRCLVCGEPLTDNIKLCFECSSKIKAVTKPYCIVCGYPLSFGDNNHFLDEYECGDCKIHKKWYSAASAAVHYNDQARALVHKFKFDGFTNLSVFLGSIILQKYLYDERLGNEDIIIPVPLHISRFRERGFNQAELIARQLTKYTSIPTETDILKRIKKTEPQYEMTLEERQKNLLNAFKVMDKNKLKNRNVLVVDDIFTTGSTAYEVSKTLIKGGAEKINFLTVCRALPG